MFRPSSIGKKATITALLTFTKMLAHPTYRADRSGADKRRCLSILANRGALWCLLTAVIASVPMTVGGQPSSEQAAEATKHARQQSVAALVEKALQEEAGRRISVAAEALGIAQQVIGSGVPGASERLYAAGSIDLIFAARPGEEFLFLIDLEGVGGQSPDSILNSQSLLNNDLSRRSNPADKISLREAWARYSFGDDAFSLTAGRVDLGNYVDANRFANDETTQFITGSLVNSPSLVAPNPGAGLVFHCQMDSYRFTTAAADGIAGGDVRYRNVYWTAQAGRMFSGIASQAAAARLWTRYQGTSSGWAVGLSADHDVAAGLGAFLRLGLNEIGKSARGESWSLGLVAERVGRYPRAAVGLGFSRIVSRSRGQENAGELFYRWRWRPYAALTPFIQLVDASDRPSPPILHRPTAVAGIRSYLSF